jgi:hypothetical protein
MPEALAKPTGVEIPAEGDDAVVLSEEPEVKGPKVKKGKVATKRLKKVAKEVKQLGVDVDVDVEEEK